MLAARFGQGPARSVGASAVSSPFPIQVAPGGRYLQTQSGTPFRLKSDAGWMLGAHASVTDQNTYMDSIKALGFNAFVLMLIVHPGGGAWTDVNEPNDFSNTPPFNTPNDFSTPNSTYFARVSDIIDRAATRGLHVQLFHTYLGFGGGNQGWESVLTSQSPTVCFNWGVFLANRFTQSNMWWMHGGDHSMSGTTLTNFQQIIAGIQSITRNRLNGSEWDFPSSIGQDQASLSYGTNPATSDIQTSCVYGASYPCYPQIDSAYSNATTIPVILEEPTYYNFSQESNNTRPEVRAGQYWAFMAGAIGGSNYGHDGRWDWRSADWLATLSNAATLDQSYRHALLDSLSSHLMRPSGTATGYAGLNLIVSGGGSGTSFVTSCLASDGSSLLAYAPPGSGASRNIHVNLTGLNGAKTAYWVDPTAPAPGSYTTIGAVSNATSSQSFTTPSSANSSGSDDWVLVIK